MSGSAALQRARSIVANCESNDVEIPIRARNQVGIDDFLLLLAAWTA